MCMENNGNRNETRVHLLKEPIAYCLNNKWTIKTDTNVYLKFEFQALLQSVKETYFSNV